MHAGSHDEGNLSRARRGHASAYARRRTRTSHGWWQAAANNLPTGLSSLVGRQAEVAEVSRLLERARLVTLTGAGGVGKTRLALCVAAAVLPRFPDGVWLAPLAPLSDPALVSHAVAAVVGVPEHGRRPLLQTLGAALRERVELVVLDNCEHVVQACAELAEVLLGVCPGLRILATSREPLGLIGEVTWRVPSLGLPSPPPPPPEQLSQYEAVRLFVERAVAARADFQVTNANAPAVAQVCWQLDGIPLAIELAAAWVRTLSVEQLAARLDDRFRLLVGGSRTAPRRQQTLRDAIEWSYDLLGDAERRLFAALGVFAGSWTLEAAETVCASERVAAGDVLGLLRQLIDKSLVVADQTQTGTRYHLLETLRAYSRDKLRAGGELRALEQRHLRWSLGVAEAAPPDALDAQHIARLGDEYDNLRAALRCCLDAGDAAAAARLGIALWPFWYIRGRYAEGRSWLVEILALPGAATPTRSRARLLSWAGHLAYCQGDFEAATALLEQALSVARLLADEQEVAVALMLQANVARAQGDTRRAREQYAAALALHRQLGHAIWTATTVGSLALVAEDEADHAAAAEYARQALELWRGLGNAWGIGRALEILARVAVSRGDYGNADTYGHEALQLQHALGHQQGLVLLLVTLGRSAHAQGDHARAGVLIEEAVSVAREAGDRIGFTRCMDELASLIAAAQPERAVYLSAAAESLRGALGARLPPDGRQRRAAWESRVRGALAARAYARAVAEGQRATFEHATTVALEVARSAATRRPERAAGVQASPLTRRELEVVALLADGLSNRQIAERLVITEGTARVHVEHILAKLELRSRLQVADWARANGLLGDAPAPT